VEIVPSWTHFKNRLVDTVQMGNNPPDIVHADGASLDVALAPRFEVGYRLGSGFGEFALGFRFLTTSGSGTGIGMDGPAVTSSRLSMEVGDLDYASRELSLWPNWDMKWRTGVRLASVYYSARADESAAEAAAGSGIVETRATSIFTGIGPHAGVELGRRLDSDTGLSVIGKLDCTTLLGRIRQGFHEESTMLGVNNLPLSGETRVSGSQAVPIMSWQLGLDWHPNGWQGVELFLGYQYEYWWNVGRMSSTTSRGELSDQGVVLRAGYNY
jgi:hypothetical protein